MSDRPEDHERDDDLLYSDAQMAKFATPRWVDSIGSVPPEEMAMMVAEDPSIILALVGALRFARWELETLRIRAAKGNRDD